MVKKTNEEFINECKEKFGDKFSYEKTQYCGAFDKVTITCKKHGDFDVVPHNFLTGKYGCPKCAKEIVTEKSRQTKLVGKQIAQLDTKPNNNNSNELFTEAFINRARKKHGDKYDYSKVEYKKAEEKVCIICPQHGEFWQTPSNHLWGVGCKKCGIEATSKSHLLTTEEFRKKAREIHGDKYDYSKSEYVGNHTKLKIICPIHGEFWQCPSVHINNKAGCPFCANKKNNSREKSDYNFIDTSKFIERAKILHLNHNYDYSKVEYRGIRIPVTVICQRHGEFQVTPDHFLYGKVTECPRCKNSKLEDGVKNMLERNNIEYLDECTGKIIPGLNRKRIDVYIPSLKIAIECQGTQHFSKKDILFLSKGKTTLEDELTNDKKKYDILQKNKIEMIYFYPKEYNEDNIEFYSDKNNIHTIEELEEYILNKVSLKDSNEDKYEEKIH